MRQLLFDMMAIVGKYGPPSYFITFTANPTWDEIKSNLYRYQKPSDRPDLISRVFRLKLRSLLADLKSGILRNHIANGWVIEYQKRGNVHAHIVLWTSNRRDLSNSDCVDDVISAEIPSSEEHPDLYDIVTTHMLHGPCGPNTSATCMKSASGSRHCRFHFPLEPRETTIIPDNGRRPLYRRRCRHSHTKKGVPMDDQWVAAYNPLLLLKYRAHINVEACTGASPVKYLIKYLHKGADMSVVRTIGENDEVSQYENSVYIGPIDSCWKLWSFPTHGQSPGVYRLNYHEPGKQPFAWPSNISDAEFRRRLENATSPLMAWFHYNQENRNG